jgi:hypothetical protein
LRIGPVTSPAAPTRPPQAPEHRIRRSTCPTAQAIKTRQLRHGKAALAIAARGQEIALLVNPTGSSLDVVIRDVEEAARASRRRLSILKASTEDEINTALATLVPLHAGGLVVMADPFFVPLAARHAVPAIYEFREFARVQVRYQLRRFRSDHGGECPWCLSRDQTCGVRNGSAGFWQHRQHREHCGSPCRDVQPFLHRFEGRGFGNDTFHRGGAWRER